MSIRRPDWIRAKAPGGAGYEEIKSLVESARLHTVCQSANCPNIGECWRERTATFMILGDTCTRSCGFCAVGNASARRQAGASFTSIPGVASRTCVRLPTDTDEPRRVADAVAYLNLRHAVITSVTRDDLPDGGASMFAETIREIHARLPGCSVEVLIPDFQGDESALHMVLDAGPEVLNHNMETVKRLYPLVRPQAVYERSIRLLERAKRLAPAVTTKSGLMLGLGEDWDEVVATMRDLRSVCCQVLSLGQYLAPSAKHVPVARYYRPEEFDKLKDVGLSMGFGYVEAGPLVRSSYHAAQQRL